MEIKIPVGVLPAQPDVELTARRNRQVFCPHALGAATSWLTSRVMTWPPDPSDGAVGFLVQPVPRPIAESRNT